MNVGPPAATAVKRPRWGYRRALASLVPVVLAAALTSGPGVATAGDEPHATPAARAEAVARASIVYVKTHWEGWVRIPPNTAGFNEGWYGSAGSNEPLRADTTCSGFVASNDGHIVTAGHCVDDQSMTMGGKAALIDALITRGAGEGLTQGRLAELRRIVETNGAVEALDSGSPPKRTVSVFQTVAVSGVPVAQPMQANVLEFRPLSGGDVAVLKVEPVGQMPALDVASESPDTGTQVIAIGYPGSVAKTTDPKLQPSFKEGATSGTQTVNGVPFVEMSAAVSPGMSGGPVIDLAGRVLRTVSWGPGEEPQAFNFITDTSTLRSLVSRNGVPTQLSAMDRDYRVGLNEYFTGHYHAAVEDLDKVLSVQPSHAQAQYYRGKAVAAYPLEKKSPLLPIGIGVVLAVVMSASLLLVHRRRAGVRGPGTVSREPASQPTASAGTPGTTGAAAIGSQAPSPDTDRLCPNCGTPHPSQAHFCASCGQPFTSAILREEANQ